MDPYKIDDLYLRLGFNKNSDLENITSDEIKKAYYRQAQIYHPDKHSEDLQEIMQLNFIAITEAYETLSDKYSRIEYNSEKSYSKFNFEEAYKKYNDFLDLMKEVLPVHSEFLKRFVTPETIMAFGLFGLCDFDFKKNSDSKPTTDSKNLEKETKHIDDLFDEFFKNL